MWNARTRQIVTRTGSRAEREKDTGQYSGRDMKRTMDKSELYDRIQRGGDNIH
jgi:hypothetical protein